MNANTGSTGRLRSVDELQRATLEAILKRDPAGLGQIAMESSFRTYNLDPTDPSLTETMHGLDAVFDASREARHQIVLDQIRDDQAHIGEF